MARESFANKTTAILAMAGSAIGLGNIWRFPYMVGQNGGAAFILVYLLSATFICVPFWVSIVWDGFLQLLKIVVFPKRIVQQTTQSVYIQSIRDTLIFENLFSNGSNVIYIG